MRHRARALGRRYGRMRGRSQAGTREIDALLKAQETPTRQAPRLSMREQISWDRRLKEIREAEKER